MNNQPLVSIVIPTKNSGRFLERCLDSIKKQTYRNIEIIVVDNKSDDNTRKVARRYTDKVFVVDAGERSEQINFGIKKSKGKYVYRVDSDFILDSNVVKEAVEKCEKEGYDAICIHNTSDPTVSFWARVRKLERDCYKGDELNVGARFFRKDIVKEIGGFDERLVAAEDYDFHNRLLKAGYKIGRIKAEEIHLGEPKSLWEVAKKHYYYGKTIVRFIEKNRGRGIKQLNPIRPAFIRHWKEFARHPLLTFGFIVYQLVKYFSGGLGYLKAKLGCKVYNKPK